MAWGGWGVRRQRRTQLPSRSPSPPQALHAGPLNITVQEASSGGSLAPVRREFTVSADRIVFGEDIVQVRLADETFEICRGQGAAKMITLILIAAGHFEKIELSGRLHPFGDDFEAQAVSERDDRADDRCILRTAHDLIDEHTVDLELIDREPAQVTHARIAG